MLHVPKASLCLLRSLPFICTHSGQGRQLKDKAFLCGNSDSCPGKAAVSDGCLSRVASTKFRIFIFSFLPCHEWRQGTSIYCAKALISLRSFGEQTDAQKHKQCVQLVEPQVFWLQSISFSPYSTASFMKNDSYVVDWHITLHIFVVLILFYFPNQFPGWLLPYFVSI